jgi:hypothetical protein
VPHAHRELRLCRQLLLARRHGGRRQHTAHELDQGQRKAAAVYQSSCGGAAKLKAVGVAVDRSDVDEGLSYAVRWWRISLAQRNDTSSVRSPCPLPVAITCCHPHMIRALYVAPVPCLLSSRVATRTQAVLDTTSVSEIIAVCDHSCFMVALWHQKYLYSRGHGHFTSASSF